VNSGSRILIAGATGLVGSALYRRLEAGGYTRLLTPTRAQLDFADRDQVERYFAEHRPEVVFLAAAKVGGILANDTWPGDFIRENLLIQTHAIDAARRHGVGRFVMLGSSCIYPKHAPQPMKEEHLLTGPLEPTNRAYAVAKIAGLEMVEAYRRQYGFNGITLMPTNLYGPRDNFDPQSSHVAAALMRRIHEAKVGRKAEVVVWGTGTPRREFLHVDDMADAAVHLAALDHGESVINVGCGEDITIRELAELIAETVGYGGRLVQDPSKPDGTPRKLLDVTRLDALGWRPGIGLREGLTDTYAWFVENIAPG
jgi:GDP-L-fucose synthase